MADKLNTKRDLSDQSERNKPEDKNQFSRREALKRIAKQTIGLAGVLAALPAFSSILKSNKDFMMS